MIRILSPEEMRLLDAAMIEAGTPGLILMENAAFACTEEILRMADDEASILVLCGGGNNGGDGLAVLRQLLARGRAAKGLLFCEKTTLSGDARTNLRMLEKAGVTIESADEAALARAVPPAGVIVDALFGTGLSRPPEGLFARAVQLVNQSNAKVLSVDLPSGVDGRTGQVPGEAVRADVTVTFQYPKRGHYLLPGREYTGRLKIAPIGLGRTQTGLELLRDEDLPSLFPRRDLAAHKGAFGKALLVAGSAGTLGAALLAARAALTAGCGLLKVGSVRENLHYFSALPEAMLIPIGDGTFGAETRERLEPLAKWAQVIGFGPGVGVGERVCACLCALLQEEKPMVIDADGLNVLAQAQAFPLRPDVILTPHPGEMARLCGLSADEITARPVEVAERYSREWNCVLLLKGATSVIAGPGGTTLNITGSPALAKGGSGDALTGIILGLLAQRFSPYDAARSAAYIFGRAAEKAAAIRGERSVLTSDVIAALELR